MEIDNFFNDGQSIEFLRKVCVPVKLCCYDNTARKAEYAKHMVHEMRR